MDPYVYEESKGFPGASTIKERTKPGHSELCFYQSFISCGKMCDCVLTLRDCGFASDKAKFLSEGVTKIQLRKCPKRVSHSAARSTQE